MTPSQQLRLQGIQVSLEQRGVDLELQEGAKPVFRALLQDVEHGDPRFELDPELRALTRVFILRNAALFSSIKVGSILKHKGEPVTYRVLSVVSRPSDILGAFECEAVR